MELCELQRRDRDLYRDNVKIDWISCLGIVALLPLAALAGFRLAGYEYSAFMVSLESVFPYLFLVAYIALLLAVLGKRLIFALLSVFLVTCHLAWTVPELLQGESLNEGEKSAQTFRVFSHNIQFDNDRPEDLPIDIRAANADVVMIQELTWELRELLVNSGALDDYRYSFTEVGGSRGLGVWSKTELRDQEKIENPGFPSQRMTTTIQGRDIVLWNVHTRSPVNGEVSFWHADLDKLREDLHRETAPVIAAGDYNATYQHAPFRALLQNGYREAVMADGRGYARTWPADQYGGQFTGALIRLDHVLINEAFAVRTTKEMTGGGSDHRAIYADLVFAQ